MGRPVLGLEHVERVDASPIAKHRLRLVIQSAVGALTGGEAAAQLNVTEQRFAKLRARLLGAAAQAGEDGTPGRPRKTISPEVVAELERKNRWLERENVRLRAEVEAAHIRTEIALALPHVLLEKRGTRRRRAAEPRPDRP